MNSLLSNLMILSLLFAPLMGIATPLGVSAVSAPEMDIQGNGVSIPDGDTTPSLGDRTDYGGVDVTGGSVEQKFIINNTGNANLNLTGSPRVAISCANAADFTVTRLPKTPVLPGGSDYFKITFTPGALGNREAVVSITNSDSNENPYTFSIQGTGATPEIDIQGNGVSIPDGDTTPTLSDHTHFGGINVSNGTVVGKFTIYNTGNANLNLTGSTRIVISGASAADFTVIRLPQTPIAPGGSDYFAITFNPSAIGARKAIITIANNDSNENPYNFYIQGTGMADESETGTPDSDSSVVVDGEEEISHSLEGIDADFNGTAAGWVLFPGGEWQFFNDTYWVTTGVENGWSGARYAATFNNFTYEVKMRREWVDTTAHPSGLVVRGTPSSLSPNGWENAYLFLYTLDGQREEDGQGGRDLPGGLDAFFRHPAG